MPRGRLFGLSGRTYGTAEVAQLMEEGLNDTKAGDCLVWSFDVEHYERTGEVQKLEFLRIEKEKGYTPKFNHEGAL